MKYITKIDKTHIVELNGRNIKIKEDTSKHLQVYILPNNGSISVDKTNFIMNSSYGSGGATLDQYVVALEVVRLILEVEG